MTMLAARATRTWLRLPLVAISVGAALLGACRDGEDLLPATVGTGGAPGDAAATDAQVGGTGGAGGGAGGAGGAGGSSADAGVDRSSVADASAEAGVDAGPRTLFTLAALPDTQYYSLAYPHVFNAQTGWLAANSRRLGIAYVLHLGDIVDQNTPEEWQRAAQAMSLLDGVLPYALATGNHDFGPFGHPSTRDTLLNVYFPFSRTASLPTFGGALETGELQNTYHLFTAGGRDFIVIALEWGPRDPVIAWANEIMAAHPQRSGILITHAYMNNNDRRYDITDTAHPQDYNPHQYPTPGGVNDGEELWQKLVRKHRFVMTLNGHVLGDGTGYLASVTDKGNLCHQMLSNYQFRSLGGEGYLRLLRFLEDGRTVVVTSYSPLLDRYLTEPDQSFQFTLD